MIKNNCITLIDFLVVLLFAIQNLSVLQCFTYEKIPIHVVILTFLFLTFSYILRFGPIIPNIVAKNSALILLMLIYVTDIVQNFFINMDSALLRIPTSMNMFIFCAYLYNLHECIGNGVYGVQKIIKPYLYYAIYTLLALFLAIALISSGVISSTDNILTTNSAFDDNMSHGESYYFPGHLSIVNPNSRLASDWGLPLFCGLSNEPHVHNLLILPSLFFLLSFESLKKYKYLIIIAYLISLFFTMSTTAFLVLTIVLTIDVVWGLRNGNDRKKMIVFIILAAGFLLSIGSLYTNLISNEIFRKTVDQTQSLDYSSRMLRYVIMPESIFGAGNLSSLQQVLSHSENIGLVTCILDISFFIVMIVKSFKIVRSRNYTIHYIGLGCLYFLLHSLKLSYAVFCYPFLIFVIMAIVLTESSIKHAENEESNSIMVKL